MNLKVSLQATTRDRPKDSPAGTLLSERYRIGHKAPLSLSKIIVVVALALAEFWLNSSCGSAEEMVEQLHKAARDLAQKEWR